MSLTRIDVHAHFLPDFYREAMTAAGIDHPDGMPAIPSWSEQAALEVMDQLDIATAMLSISSPGVNFGDDEAAKVLARQVNEEGTRLKQAHGKRFGLFAAMPLPDIAAAAREAVFALDELKAEGIAIETSYRGMYLGDPRLEPFYAALNDRDAVLFLHPTTGPCPDLAFGLPRPALEFMFETTRTVIYMIVSGVTQRYPNIRIIVPHAGAALPVIASRVEFLLPLLTGATNTHAPSIQAELKRLYYDLAGAPLPVLLSALLQVASPDNILYGSDWPFTNNAACLHLASQLDQHPEVQSEYAVKFMRANAQRLWPDLCR
jgi:predicted TIM-barrel fold metal-dependent hydrolase